MAYGCDTIELKCCELLVFKVCCCELLVLNCADLVGGTQSASSDSRPRCFGAGSGAGSAAESCSCVTHDPTETEQ